MEAEHGGCKSGSDPSSSSRKGRQNSVEGDDKKVMSACRVPKKVVPPCVTVVVCYSSICPVKLYSAIILLFRVRGEKKKKKSQPQIASNVLSC